MDVILFSETGDIGRCVAKVANSHDVDKTFTNKKLFRGNEIFKLMDRNLLLEVV